MTSPLHHSEGLSPRVRGNPDGAGQRNGAAGSIPACAGEPTGWRATSRRRRVYPRVCGGTVGGAGGPRQLQGLSPRVRGNPSTPTIKGQSPRSIPACAGEPGGLEHALPGVQVYPRVCGGTRRRWAGRRSRRGLSPRVRGNQSPIPGNAIFSGTIPACAGEPAGRRAGSRRVGVYPRVCGGTSSPFL